MTNCKVISHRGANKYAPQNTIPAFERSISIGVDGFETDVHLTKDGVPVICHNYTVDATSNGMGSIEKYEFNEIRKLDFGAYFNGVSDNFRGTLIPSLDEFLCLVEKSDIEIMNIELKSPKNGKTDIVKKTIELVKKHGLFEKLIISSFDYRLLIEAKRIDEHCKTGFLYSPNSEITYKMWFRAVAFAKKIKADALHPHYSFVNPLYVKLAHKSGVKVNVWTVNSENLMKYMIKCGVDGLITNCPDRANYVISHMNDK